MRFWELGGKRSVQRPGFDPDQLADGPAALDGEFELVGARVRGGGQPGVTGFGDITRSAFHGVDLSDSELGAPLRLTDVELHDVSLNNARWREIVARRVEIVECQALGFAMFCDVAREMYVADCRLDYATINIERVKGTVAFRNCSFTDAVINGDVSGAIFLDCDFGSAEFAVRGARNCDMRTSRLAGARGLGTLRGAIIDPAQAVSIAGELAIEAGFRIEE